MLIYFLYIIFCDVPVQIFCPFKKLGVLLLIFDIFICIMNISILSDR